MRHFVILFLCIVISNTAFSQDPFCEAIVTQGKASYKQNPETISFHIDFRVMDKDYDKCTNTALKKIDSLKIKFRENKIDENLILTSSYSISETSARDNRTNKQVHTGYQARIPIYIRTQVDDPSADKIFELVKSTLKTDVKINFELSPSQIDEVKETLISMAVEDATSKAKILTKNLEVQLGKILKVQYGDILAIRNFTNTNYELRSIRQRNVSAVSRVSITTLKPHPIEMTTEVMLAWEIEY